MQLRQIHETCRPELKTADFRSRRARRGMIPGSDDQIVTRPALGGRILHVLAIVRECPRLIAIVGAGDGQNRNAEARVLLGGRIVGIPKGVRMRVLYTPLKYGGRGADW